jgi:hypothetical protein
MHIIVFIAIKMDVHAARYLAINCNEVTMINNQSWVNIHVYLDFKYIPILLHLERLVNGGNVDNLINVILKSLMVNGGLPWKRLTTN